jgi:hypothetical protein
MRWGDALAILLKWSNLLPMVQDLYRARCYKAHYSTARQSRPLSAQEDEEPTGEWSVSKAECSCRKPQWRGRSNRLAAQEGLDDAHRRATTRADERRLNRVARDLGVQ